MISLCDDINMVKSAIEGLGGNRCIKGIMHLYLESYGVSYDFNQFYIQYCDHIPTALLHRYNTQVYVIASVSCDRDELLPFLKGFAGCQVIAAGFNFSDFVGAEECCVMSKFGEKIADLSSDIRECTDAKLISELVCANENKDKRTDFFLNTAHQLRYNKLKVKCYYKQDIPVCVASSTILSPDSSVLTFVYTNEYFRGNGYMKKLLANICDNHCKEYLLLCEKHNLPFYEKCGFKLNSRVLKFSL